MKVACLASVVLNGAGPAALGYTPSPEKEKRTPVTAAFIRSMGLVTSHGPGIGVLLEALEREIPCPRRRCPLQQGSSRPLPSAGWIDPMRPVRRIARFGRMDRLTRLTLVAAQLALQGEEAVPVAAGQAGVVLGTVHGSHQSNEEFQGQLVQHGPQGVSPALFSYTLPSAPTGEVSIHLGLKGAAVTLTQGLGAGLSSLAMAASLLEQGRLCWVLAGGVDVLSPTLLASDGGGASTLAEGAGLLSLTPQADGALARLAGAAQGLGEGIEREALRQAGLTDEEVRHRLVYRSDDVWPGQHVLGRCQAAAPVLGLCVLLHRPGSLPALVVAEDERGLVDAICLTEPAAP